MLGFLVTAFSFNGIAPNRRAALCRPTIHKVIAQGPFTVDRIAPGRAAQRVKIEPGGAAHGDAQERFEDTAHANATIRCVAAGRRGALNSYRGVRVRVGAIFDVRALLMPPLAAERIVRLSTGMGFRAEVLA